MAIERSFFVQSEEFRRECTLCVQERNVCFLCENCNDGMLPNAESFTGMSTAFEEFECDKGIFSTSNGNENLFL
ncbi:hypothetical protein COW95_03875 [Candidatus Peregrinibacteria bacterium CG22_combo_CG10-13_8_21_14_all_49_11]|nr:MAG: hypothetical protein COW95_03875 [Candidatus Peregrinibacteria bacterium CG22_combo_CG10-13_8_21_14_all_49_11]